MDSRDLTREHCEDLVQTQPSCFEDFTWKRGEGVSGISNLKSPPGPRICPHISRKRY